LIVIARAAVKMILPLACSWVRKQEAFILETGVALSVAQMADARKIGLEHAERVRLKFVEKVPLPLFPRLRKAAERFRAFPSDTIGITLRYGIFIQSRYANDRRLLLHELAHILQYERFGGIRPFLEQYLRECLTAGYPFGSLEEEARRITKENL
jgi:hypothetical protein